MSRCMREKAGAQGIRERGGKKQEKVWEGRKNKEERKSRGREGRSPINSV